jgi:putative peptide zinc metalloprotease protein
MNLSLESHLKLVKLEIKPDKKHFIVEDVTSGDFYEMPETCIEAINLINMGVNLFQIEQQLKLKYPAEEVDILDFANQLSQLELIAEIDGVKIERVSNDEKSGGFLWISPKLGKFFFNKVTLRIYFILMIVNMFILVFHPGLFPHYKDLFLSNYMVLNIPSWLIITYSLVLLL